jgi:hypothetical protein
MRDAKRGVIALEAIPDPWDIPTERSVVSFAHVKALLAAEPEVARSLRSALPDELLSKKVMEFGIDDSQQAALPWEWAWGPDVLCFRSSRLLRRTRPGPFLRMMWWPKLPAQLKRVLSSIRPMRAVILRQPVSFQERNRRGFDLISRRSLGAIYKSNGVSVFEPDQLVTGSIAEAFQMRHPSIIHIQASVVEQEGTLLLDLPVLRDGLSIATELVTPDYLTALFRSLDTRNAPLLILDPPRPPDEGEVVRQLLLRNRFAADLVALGQSRAVLCVGLFDNAVVELAALRLAQEISLNPEFKQLFFLCRNEIGSDRFSRAAALFAAEPEDLVR